MITRVWIKQLKDELDVVEKYQDGYEEVWVQWLTPTFEKIKRIESECIDLEGKFDFYKREELIWKFLLKSASWFTVKRVRGKVSQDQLDNNVYNLQYKVYRELAKGIVEDLSIGEQEEREIGRQAAIIFNSKGSNVVRDACPAIQLYCEARMFWEKFGLNLIDLKKIPQSTVLRLKHIANLEVERINSERRQAEQKSRSRTK